MKPEGHLPVPTLKLKLFVGFIGLVLFIANTLPQIYLYLNKGAHIVPYPIPLTGDNFQYITWIEAHRSALRIPNYHLSEPTDSAFIVPIALFVSSIANLFHIDSLVAYQVVRLFVYICTAFAGLYFFRTFLRTPGQLWLALCFAIACVPIKSILVFFMPMRPQGFTFGVPGSGEYMYTANTVLQDWNHSLPGAVGALCACVGLAACIRYIMRASRSDLILFSATCGISALLHPFEVVYLLVFATLAHCLHCIYKKSFYVPRFLLLPIVLSALGLLVYVIPAYQSKWVQQTALLNRQALLMPFHALIEAFGLPVFVCIGGLAWLLLKQKEDSFLHTLSALALSLYLILPFASFLPFARHMLSGISLLIGALCAQIVWPNLWRGGRLRVVVAHLSVFFILLVGLTSHIGLRYIAFVSAVSPDGALAEKSGFPRSFLTADEASLLHWFRQNASSGDSVMAGGPAALLATVPMRSFASHSLFSHKKLHESDWRMRDRIVVGEANWSETRLFLRERQVRYVVLEGPEGNLEGCQLRFKVGKYSVHDCGGTGSGSGVSLRRALR